MGEARRPGRPRSETVDAAIIESTVEELIERGILGMSIESIAARAGVAKTSIYRRWPNSHDLALDAMRSFSNALDEPPAGSARDQLVWLIDRMRRTWADPRFGAIMRRAAADGSVQPELYRQSRDRFVQPYVKLMNDVLVNAVTEGLIRPDVDLAWVRQMLTAPILAAALTLRDRVTRAQVEFTVDTVLRGAAPLAG